MKSISPANAKDDLTLVDNRRILEELADLRTVLEAIKPGWLILFTIKAGLKFFVKSWLAANQLQPQVTRLRRGQF